MKITQRTAALAVLIIVLVSSVAFSVTRKPAQQPSLTASGGQQSLPATESPAKVETVRLLTGSAKFGFFKDPKVEAALAARGIKVQLSKTGSFADDSVKSGSFDAVWPAGLNAAQDFNTAWKGVSQHTVFSTPLAIASWKALMPALQANGLAKMEDAHGIFYLDKALPLMLAGKKWNQLAGNTSFQVNKPLLVNTPDIRRSNTGMMYLAAMAYISNAEEVPRDIAAGEKLAEKLSPLITRQGMQEGTLAGPFEDYLGQGMGKAPLVLIYESQYVEAKRDGSIRDGHVLLYPQPGLMLKHIVVARTPLGTKLGTALAEDPELQRLAAQYGFRTNQLGAFKDAMGGVGLDAPELNNLAEVPSTAIFDAMTRVLVKKLEGAE